LTIPFQDENATIIVKGYELIKEECRCAQPPIAELQHKYPKRLQRGTGRDYLENRGQQLDLTACKRGNGSENGKSKRR
jgi:hypothetical protein